MKRRTKRKVFKKVKIARVKPMARRRTARTRSRRSYFRLGAKRRGGRKSQKLDLMGTVLAAGIYGVGREPVAGLISPVTNMLPVGDYKDEVGMALVSYFMAKKGTGIIKNVGKAGLTIEAYRASTSLAGGLFGGKSSSNGTQVYG